jgi:hypothetical protein
MASSIHDPQVAEYIQRGTPHEQAIIQALIEVIFEAEPSMEEAMKWRRITYTAQGNWHHWICGIEITKKYVSLVFHKGALLQDPSGKRCSMPSPTKSACPPPKPVSNWQRISPAARKCRGRPFCWGRTWA